MTKQEKFETDLAKIVAKYTTEVEPEFWPDNLSWHIDFCTFAMVLDIHLLCKAVGIDISCVDWDREETEIFLTDEWYYTTSDEEYDNSQIETWML